MSATDQPKSVVSVPLSGQTLEAIAHNLCSLHDFDPVFVAGQERFAKAVITEFLRATPALAAAPLPQEGLADAVQWHRTAESEPEPGLKFVALYDDGSGAWLGFKHDGGVIDADGDDYGKMPNAEWWAYLPTGFRLGCEDHPCSEQELNLPDHAPPPLLAQPPSAPRIAAARSLPEGGEW